MINEDRTRIDWTIELEHSSALGWKVTCEYLTIHIDSLSYNEAIHLTAKIVEVLEAMFP